jgi:hypothetical protein
MPLSLRFTSASSEHKPQGYNDKVYDATKRNQQFRIGSQFVLDNPL